MKLEHSSMVSKISEWLYSATGYTKSNDWEVIGKVVSNVGKSFARAVIAYNKRDLAALREEWATIRIHLDGLAAATNIDLDNDFIKVCASHLSRFDLSESVAKETQNWATGKGIKTRIVHNTTLNIYSVMVSEAVTTEEGIFYPSGMWLVSIKAFKPKLIGDYGMIDSLPDSTLKEISVGNLLLTVVDTA